MASITPVRYEVVPTGNSPKVDSSPWHLFLERDEETDFFFLWKDDKVLIDDDLWHNLDWESGYLPNGALLPFGDAVTRAARAVDAYKVEGKTYYEALTA